MERTTGEGKGRGGQVLGMCELGFGSIEVVWTRQDG